MNRRSFLGKLFGTVAASPFLFKLIEELQQRPLLSRFRMGIVTPDDDVLQVPATSLIVEAGKATLKAEPLEVAHMCQYKGLHIFDAESNRVLFMPKFSGIVHCFPEDRLLVKYDITWDSKYSFEDALKDTIN